MELYNFINSQDIAEHCRKLNYLFGQPEAAYLIWRSIKHTIEEKHIAWKQLIETTPDMSITNTEYNSLHCFLNKYIEMENKLLDEFYTEGDNIKYSYTCYYENQEINFRSHTTFESLSLLYNDLNMLLENENYTIDLVLLDKQEKNRTTTLFVLPNGKELRWGSHDIMHDECGQYHTFRNMCPIIPTPFQKGDIVTFVSLPEVNSIRYKSFLKEEVYVLDCIGIENVENMFTKHAYLWHDAQDKHIVNDSLMLYGVGEFGYIQHSCEPFFLDNYHHNYLDLVYYHKELNGKQCILTSVSNYLKGNIDLSFLMNAHFAIMLEGHSQVLLSEFYEAKFCGAYPLPLHLAGIAEQEILNQKYNI